MISAPTQARTGHGQSQLLVSVPEPWLDVASRARAITPVVSHQNMFEVEEVNCICVDWKRGSQTTYSQAVNNVRVVGAQVAQMLDVLKVSGGATGPSRRQAGPWSHLGQDAAGIIKKSEKELIFLLVSYFENSEIRLSGFSGRKGKR